MIWGVTLRSPHPHARIKSVVDRRGTGHRRASTPCSPATTSPASNACGLEHADQPVLAADVVRYAGEPVALVAADHPEIARLAASKIVVDYEVLDPVTDPVAALDPAAPARAPGRQPGQAPEDPQGRPRARAPTWSSPARYEIGMQDQAFLGPEAGLAVPDGAGGVDLFVSTQWLHVDQQPGVRRPRPAARPGAADAGRGRRRVRRPRGPVHARARLPARAAHRQAGQDGLLPRGVVLRPRAPASGPDQVRARRQQGRHAGLRQGRRFTWTAAPTRRARSAVVANAGTMGAGPYVVPNVRIDAYGVYTNNPPCGAMRGFGNVQAAFGYEAQMDKLAAALRHGPGRVPLPERDGDGQPGPTGQVVDSPAPVAEMLRRVRQMPLPEPARPQRERPRPAASCRAASATPPTARASRAASATPSDTRTSASPRASTTTRPRGCGSRSWRASRS